MASKAETGSGRRGLGWRIAGWAAGTGLLLLVPLVAMRFTHDVVWTTSDFVFAGLLLFGSALAYELIASTRGGLVYRGAVAAAIGTAFLLIWANGAVGLIGGEREDANLLYGGVLAVALIGALIGRFRPSGMARALFATAFAQALVPLVALGLGLGSMALIWTQETLVVSGGFVALWLLAAGLFVAAARSPTPAD
ncbi:hypothetical protein [Caulobacter sp. 17J80-11]|uniref:hypothetical protein n=1 Tax=Caulobacter sp. 17J80-11 TaxID=2763502 RepID=UPI0016538A8F|nr:hypothetical protein [Caulobacter sp. 17J80-11]MBC6983602.1 hypothetical protein [Caulobacter sp. 17J80-11]